MINRSQTTKQLPLNMVGSSTFGRYPKISVEKTYNMFQSDNWMVPYAGYENIIKGTPGVDTRGRVLYTSNILNCMIAIWDTTVYRITIIFDALNNKYTLQKLRIGNIENHNTDIFIAENPNGQIAITDGFNVYVYDVNQSNTFTKVTVDFQPGFITYQDTHFIAAALHTSSWRLSESSDVTGPTTGALSWPPDNAHKGQITTKPDHTVATLRVPSRGNMLYVFGTNVVEAWFDAGLQGFQYQRSQSFNIDYGCINASTIASNDEYVVWLAQNEKSGPIIMYTDGGTPEKITTDGIDFLLSSLEAPNDSEAFMYRQDGHLFYHINFYTDNLSLFYDFNDKKFYHACDENGDYFIAKDVAFYNNQYYFVSYNNGNLYAFDTQYTTYDGHEIPRIRTCRNIRLPTQEYFLVNDLGFTLEQGTTDYTYTNQGDLYFITESGNRLITQNGNYLILQQGDIVPKTPRVDMSISTDGGQSFGSFLQYPLNPIGRNRNMLRFWRLGLANDFVAQFRFYGIGRFVCTDGIVNIRQ